MSEILEQIQREPQNAFAHYRLAMSMDGLQKSRNVYRAIRLVVHPAGAAIGMALGKTLQVFDRENVDPKQSALLCCAMAATKTIQEEGLDPRQCLVLGVASLHLSTLMPAAALPWRARAKKAFSLAMAGTDNAFVAADAALGLQQVFELEQKPALALEYREFAQAVGSKSSLLGFKPGSGPSIWDVTAKPIDVEQRIRNTVLHVATRQTARTRNLLTKGAEALENWTKEL